MKKRVLAVIITFLMLIIIIPSTTGCWLLEIFGFYEDDDEEEEEGAKEAIAELGSKIKEEVEQVQETLSGDSQQKIHSHTEENKDKDSDGDSSTVEDSNLDKEDRSYPDLLYGKIACKNEITGEETGAMTITFNWEENTIGGESNLLWYEYLETIWDCSDCEEHHSHKIICKISLKGTVNGKIDNSGNINGTMTGYTNCYYGYNPKSTEHSIEACELCKEKFDHELKTFSLKGKYREDSISMKARGFIIENGARWEVGIYK